jgi:hypothetical protein
MLCYEASVPASPGRDGGGFRLLVPSREASREASAASSASAGGGGAPSALLAGLAALHKEQGDAVEAERLFVRAIAADTLALGERHVDTLASVTALGSLLRAQNR